MTAPIGRTRGGLALVATVWLWGGCGPALSKEPMLKVEGGSDSDVRYSDREALPKPPKISADTPNAAYLESVAERIQPVWSSFLEDCRVRLPASHKLNNPSLESTIVFVLDSKGRILSVRTAKSSGHEEFDSVALEIANDLGTLAPPPIERVSDDDRIYLQWGFARDVRQAGPSQAAWQFVELPFAKAFPKLMAAGQHAVAARRLTRANLPENEAVASLVQIAKAVVGTGLTASESDGKAVALRTVGEAGLKSYLPEVRLAIRSTETEVAIAAIKALAKVGGSSDVGPLLSLAQGDGGVAPDVSAAAAFALGQLGSAGTASKQATTGLRSKTASVRRAALAVLSVLEFTEATSMLGSMLSGGKTSREERTAAASALGRQAVATGKAAKVLLSATSSGNGAIRAASVDALAAAARSGVKNRLAYWRALELFKDRDERVRAAAIRAAAALDPQRFAKELPTIRAAGSKLVLDSIAEVVGIVPGPVALDRLLDLSVSSDAGTRLWAAKGLAARSEPKAKEALAALLLDDAAEVRLAALTDGVGDEQLVTLLADPSARVQARALAILTGRLGKAKTSGRFAEVMSRADIDAQARQLWVGAWLKSGK